MSRNHNHYFNNVKPAHETIKKVYDESISNAINITQKTAQEKQKRVDLFGDGNFSNRNNNSDFVTYTFIEHTTGNNNNKISLTTFTIVDRSTKECFFGGKICNFVYVEYFIF